MKALSLTLLAALAFFPAAKPIFGELIVSDSAGGTSGSTTGFFAVSWTQTGTFNNVSIEAQLESSQAGASTGTAYLSNKLGTGAGSGNLLDTFAVSTNNNSPGVLIPLFSGLTLGPGTYYLSIQDNFGLYWDLAGTPVQTLASGVTQGLDLVSSGAIGTPAISTSFIDTTEINHPLFQVTGDLVTTTTATPEPSMIGFLSAGLGLLFFARRLRNRQV
jgi:hypothetical protein